MATADADKELVRRFVQGAQGNGDLALVHEMLAPGFVDHSAFPGFPPDRDGVKLLFSALHAGIPDLQVTIHDQLAGDGKVVTRKTLHGTHDGNLFGIPATGNPVSFQVIDILRIEDGLITDHWNQIDALGLMTQLGVISRS